MLKFLSYVYFFGVREGLYNAAMRMVDLVHWLSVMKGEGLCFLLFVFLVLILPLVPLYIACVL